MQFLEKINGHEDLVQLTDAERTELCREIREFLVENVSKTGGHLASNLGIVELAVAIETVFDTKKDRLVFDVGHQSYVHKLLTGRKEEFSHLRQFGGMAGFPKPGESDTDAFIAGHASSSVSVALGMARARSLQGEDYHVIALLGDGAATGGMAYEGMDNAAVSKEPMIIILNDNKMSIAPNVGGVAKHLSKLRSSDEYLRFKQKYRRFMKKIPGGKAVYFFSSRVKNRIKRLILPTTIFENMGLTYLGPVDGHDLPELIGLLKSAREIRSPVLLHITTKKGKGYLPAESDPAKFHGIGKFDKETGAPCSGGQRCFSDVFGETMLELAAQDSTICAITAAMPGGTGLLDFQKHFPNRLFDVGIAEEHAVSMAGGLAKQGMKPVVAIYSTFLQRAFDQIMQDVAMLHLHVVFAVDRAGLVGEDGETHHGIYDVGFLRQIPGMKILCPLNFAEQKMMFSWALQNENGPVAIRYPRGGEGSASDSCELKMTDLMCHRSGRDLAFLTYGTITNQVLAASDLLKENGIEASVIRLLTVSPLPFSEIVQNCSGQKRFIIVEEAAHSSGVGQDLSSQLQTAIPGCSVSRIDLGDQFVTHGKTEILYKQYGLDAESIAAFATEALENEK